MSFLGDWVYLEMESLFVYNTFKLVKGNIYTHFLIRVLTKMILVICQIVYLINNRTTKYDRK